MGNPKDPPIISLFIFPVLAMSTGKEQRRGSCAPVLELEFRNCFWVQKTALPAVAYESRPLQIALPAVAYESRPLQIALPAVAYEFRKLSSAVGHRRSPYRQWPWTQKQFLNSNSKTGK